MSRAPGDPSRPPPPARGESARESASDPHAEWRKRLRFRAWRRGFKEADLVMGGFADAHLHTLDEAGLAAFEALLHETDQDVYDWVLGRAPAPARAQGPVLDAIAAFAASGGAEIKR